MKIIFNGTAPVYCATDGLDVTQWPHVVDGANVFIMSPDFTPTVVDAPTGSTDTDYRNYSDVNGVCVYTAPPPAPSPSPEQQYKDAIAAGLIVTSTGTPAISGTYPVDDASQAAFNAEATFISNFSEFTTGTSSMPWLIFNGAVTFTSTAQFLSVAKVVAQYISACKLAAAGLNAFPSNQITIP